jgi:ABC-type multidrug transport system ATPase subunit
VRESIEFAAKLRLKGTLDQKLAIVERLIEELGLSKCAGTKIGGTLFKGVSGGERKRTCIAIELVTNPSLIFLDEPTTGLDSFTAATVVQTLKDLAMNGKTIITTIHQPKTEIFESFDRLMLLARGKIIYFNEARLAVDYFGSLGAKYTCPEWENPADFFMEMMSIEGVEEIDIKDNNRIKSKLEI